MRAFLIPALLALAALPLASRADEPLAAPEFEAYVQGKTLYFGLGGQPYGAEEYLPDRHVRWSFLDGRCKDGRWYEEAGMICFVYEDTSDNTCFVHDLLQSQTSCVHILIKSLACQLSISFTSQFLKCQILLDYPREATAASQNGACLAGKQRKQRLGKNAGTAVLHLSTCPASKCRKLE